MSRMMLALLALVIAAPAQAQSNDWYDCVVARLLPEEALQGSVATGAIAVANRCKSLYRGKPGGDVDDAVALIERIRHKVAARQPVPLPRGDLRF